MYRLATMLSVTDRRTDRQTASLTTLFIMPITEHTACSMIV